jgi:hypothetical protein
MIADNQIRQQILRKIHRIPSSKLHELNEYLSKLEQIPNHASGILSYAGCWNNMEESAFNELTDNLIANRNKNSQRFDE